MLDQIEKHADKSLVENIDPEEELELGSPVAMVQLYARFV